MENPKNENIKSEEVNIGQFFTVLSDIGRSIWQTFIHSLALIRRITIEKLKFLIMMASLGGILGFVYGSFIKTKYYESSMILNSEHLNKRILDNAIDKLNRLTGEPGKVGLKKTLNIGDTLAHNIKGFEGKPFMDEQDIIELELLQEQLKNSKLELENPKVIDEVIKLIEVENRHSFELKVYLYNPDQFKVLEEALVSYLKNSPYVKKRIQFNHINLSERQKQLQNDLHKMDSLKAAINKSYESSARQKDGSNNIVLKDDAVSGSVDVYKQSFVLYDAMDDVNEALYLESDFEVVDGFTELNVPASASLTEVIFISLILGLSAGYLMIGLKGLNKKLENLA